METTNNPLGPPHSLSQHVPPRTQGSATNLIEKPQQHPVLDIVTSSRSPRVDKEFLNNQNKITKVSSPLATSPHTGRLDFLLLAVNQCENIPISKRENQTGMKRKWSVASSTTSTASSFCSSLNESSSPIVLNTELAAKSSSSILSNALGYSKRNARMSSASTSEKATAATASQPPSEHRVAKQDQKLILKSPKPPVWTLPSTSTGMDGTETLRKGRWTREEEAYAENIISSYRDGSIVLRHSMSLRRYLAELLHCDPMRISKKFPCLKAYKVDKKKTIVTPTAAAAPEPSFYEDERKNFNAIQKRRGRWTREEEAYAEAVIEAFKSGMLPTLPGSTSLRKFLAEVLRCHPMRVSKKFVGCVRKYHHYKKSDGEEDGIDSSEKNNAELKQMLMRLYDMEERFLKSIENEDHGAEQQHGLSSSSSTARQQQQHETSKVEESQTSSSMPSQGFQSINTILPRLNFGNKKVWK